MEPAADVILGETEEAASPIARIRKNAQRFFGHCDALLLHTRTQSGSLAHHCPAEMAFRKILLVGRRDGAGPALAPETKKPIDGTAVCIAASRHLNLPRDRRTEPIRGDCISGSRWCLSSNSCQSQFTVIVTALDGIPLATTSKVLLPVSAVAGTSKFVVTFVLPVATPIVLCPWVRA